MVSFISRGDETQRRTPLPVFFPTPSVFCNNLSTPPTSPTFFIPLGPGSSPKDPAVFSLGRTRLGKQATAAVCVHVWRCVHVRARVVSPHMLALTCRRARIMSYKPLLKVDLFTLLLANSSTQKRHVRPLAGVSSGIVRKATTDLTNQEKKETLTKLKDIKKQTSAHFNASVCLKMGTVFSGV